MAASPFCTHLSLLSLLLSFTFISLLPFFSCNHRRGRGRVRCVKAASSRHFLHHSNIYTYTSLFFHLRYSRFSHLSPVPPSLPRPPPPLHFVMPVESLYFPTSTDNKKCKEGVSAQIPLFYSFFTLICISLLPRLFRFS